MRRPRTTAEIAAGVGAASESALKRLSRDERVGVRDCARRELRRRTAAKAERERLERMLAYERELWARGVVRVAGIDEVGVGPLAGPVVAAAVILPPGCSITGIDDSKQLDHEARVRLAGEIRERAVAYAIASCSVDEIDRWNIYRASLQAMHRAVMGLRVAPEHLLVDARTVPAVTVGQTAIIQGDAKSQSIAAASIVAKVERDALMERLAQKHPGYGFEKHKGYATPEHFEALRRLGACDIHRRSFSPVAVAERQAELFATDVVVAPADDQLSLPLTSR